MTIRQKDSSNIRKTYKNVLYGVDKSLIEFARSYKPSKAVLAESERIRKTPINAPQLSEHDFYDKIRKYGT